MKRKLIILIGLVFIAGVSQALVMGRNIGKRTITESNIASSVGMTVPVVDMFLAPDAAATTNCTDGAIVDTLSLGTSGITQPDYARNVQTYLANAANCTGTITITGVDVKGIAITEDIAFTGCDTDPVGSKAFARITSIVGDATLTANAGSSDTISLGYGDKLGLTKDILSDTPYKVIEDGSDVAPTSVTIDGTYDTYDPVANCDATKNFVIYYKTNLTIVGD